MTQSAYHVSIPLTSPSSWLDNPIVQSNGSSLAPPSQHQFESYLFFYCAKGNINDPIQNF